MCLLHARIPANSKLGVVRIQLASVFFFVLFSYSLTSSIIAFIIIHFIVNSDHLNCFIPLSLHAIPILNCTILERKKAPFAFATAIGNHFEYYRQHFILLSHALTLLQTQWNFAFDRKFYFKQPMIDQLFIDWVCVCIANFIAYLDR